MSVRSLRLVCGCLQLISAGLTWFLDGVYVTLPTTTTNSLSVTVSLRDTTSTLLADGRYTRVQVSQLICISRSESQEVAESCSRNLRLAGVLDAVSRAVRLLVWNSVHNRLQAPSLSPFLTPLAHHHRDS